MPDSIEGTIDTPSIVYAGIQSQSSSLPSLNELLIEYRARSRGFETRSNSQSPAVSGSHSNPERARTYRTNPEKACEPGSMESIIKDTQQDRIESASESSAHRPSSYNSQGSVSLQSYQSAELSEQEPTSQTSARPVSNPNKMDKSTYSLKRSTLPRSQNRQSALSDDHKPIDEETAMLRTQNHHAATSSVRETAKPIPGISSNPSYRYAPPGLFATSPLYELLTNPHAEPRRASYGGVQPSMTQTLEEENIEPRRRASSTDVKYIGTEIVDKDQQVAPPALGDDQSRLEVQDMTVPVELPLPVRLPPHDDGSTLQMNTSSSDEENGTLASTSMLYPVDLGKMQFVIPLNVIPSTRDQYVSTINYYRRHIQCLMQEAVPNQETVDKIKQMLSRASDATTHIDLLHESDDPSQQMVDPVEEAAWAISNSQKFQFLQELFQALLRASKPCHLAIVAKQGKSMGILEMFLRGKKITYHRFDTNTRSPLEVQECVEVALMPSGSGGSHFRALRNDLVIAFDGSFNADDEQVKALRTLTYSVRLSPVVHLLIHNSVEHIEHCIPQNANDTHRLRMIVGYILTLKKEVGKGDPNDFTTEEQAQMVAKYVHTPREDREWQLPSIRPIEEIEFLESQAESPPEKTSQEIRGSGGLKRSLVSPEVGFLTVRTNVSVQELDIDSSASPKRQRVTPAAEVTHISDSVATQSQTTIESLTRSLQSAELATSQQSQRADRALVDYQKTRTMLEEHIAALSALQYQYESRSRLIAQMRDNNKDLTASLENAKFKVQSLMDELAINKEARKNLEVDLKEARLQLANSSNPAVQELAEATLARVKAEESLQKVQKKYDLSLKDLDFTRQQYQTASTSAVEISANANALERQVAELTYKADARVIQLQERNQATASARLQARVRELEQIISQRDSMLRRKEEEVRDLGRRGRGMQTRGTSVTPASATGRSPKANASSRGVSPATETSVIVNNPRFLAPTAAPMERTGSGRGRGRGAGAGAAGGDRGTGQSGRSTPVPTTGHRRQISGNGNTRSVGGGVPMVRTGSGLRRQIGDDDDGRQ